MAFMIDYGTDWREGYIDLCNRVARNGEVRASRVGETMEMRDYVFTLNPGAYDAPVGTDRRMHMALGAAEAIQLCAGVGFPELTNATSSQIAAFVTDPDGTIHGNYGKRVGFQLVDVVTKLNVDRSTRQAVIAVWDHQKDSAFRRPMPKDIPCTLSITFSASSGALDMSVTMRSNDVWLGVPYDVFQFRQLQRTISNVTNIPMGQYTHHAVSMHAYDKDMAGINRLQVHQGVQEEYLPNGLHPAGGVGDLPACLFRVLRGEDVGPPSHEWYHQQLGKAYGTTNVG
jgi:thymidylate synthase